MSYFRNHLRIAIWGALLILALIIAMPVFGDFPPPPETTPEPPKEMTPIPTIEEKVVTVESTGPSTKGALITVANKEIQLPPDAYIAHDLIDVVCVIGGPPCPETPLYVLARWNSTIMVSIPSGIIYEEKIGEGDVEPFQFLKEALPSCHTAGCPTFIGNNPANHPTLAVALSPLSSPSTKSITPGQRATTPVAGVTLLPPLSPTQVISPLTPRQLFVRNQDLLLSENATTPIPTPTTPPEAPFFAYGIAELIPSPSKRVGVSSDLVVVAEVVAVQSWWDTADGKRPANPHDGEYRHHIYTETTVKVETGLVGDAKAGDQLTLIQTGGQVGEDQLIFDDGYPPFVIGERVVLFLNRGRHAKFGKVYYTARERYWIDPATQLATNPFFQKPLATMVAEMAEVKEIKAAIREGRFTPPATPWP